MASKGAESEARVGDPTQGRRHLQSAQEPEGTPSPSHSEFGPAQLLDLRSVPAAPPRQARLGGTAGSPQVPLVPGWRFVENGTALAFSDGRAWRRTIVLPGLLDEPPREGIARTLADRVTRSRHRTRESLDELRRLLLVLVAMTDFREQLYRAALDDVTRPLIVERKVQFEGSTKESPSPGEGRIEEGVLRIGMDYVTFHGPGGTRHVTGGRVISVHEDVGLGHVSIVEADAGPWALQGLSPVAVFAAASACRLNADDARRYRAQPAKLAQELLDPNDPGLLVPGDDHVLEVEGICRELTATHGWWGRARRPR